MEKAKRFTCPSVLKDPIAHRDKKQEAILSNGLGPLRAAMVARNVGFWIEKAQIFKTSPAVAQSTIRCAKCEYFDTRPEMIRCIEKGETSWLSYKSEIDPKYLDLYRAWSRRMSEHGPGIGYCPVNDIKVGSGNSCNSFVPVGRLSTSRPR